MPKSEPSYKPSREIALRYLDDMAKTLPTISSSDEFYFFPRGKRGSGIETMGRDEIGELARRLQEYLLELEDYKSTVSVDEGDTDAQLSIEEQIDNAVTIGSIKSAIRELVDYPVWRIDPTFYLTVLLEGLTGAIKEAKDPKADDGVYDGGLSRAIYDGTKLIRNATANLMEQRSDLGPSELVVSLAHEMVGDGVGFLKGSYLDEIMRLGSSGEIGMSRLLSGLDNLVDALMDFRNQVGLMDVKKGSLSTGLYRKEYINRVLRESYGLEYDIDEVREIGEEIFEKGMEELTRHGKELSNDGWLNAFEGFVPPRFVANDLIGMYEGEVKRIRDFLQAKGIIDPTWAGECLVKEVPVFLRSVRSAAAYSSPSLESDEPGIFYIIPTLGNGSDDAVLLSHREFIYMTAHETYPGHHILDGVRTGLENPVRSRVESPLFYEGWACYAESLLFDSGYEAGSEYERNLLLQGKRREVWRAARLLIDIDLCYGMGPDDAAELLYETGRPKFRVKREARRIALTPGYQLTYTLGKYEIMRLKEKYMDDLDTREFHRMLLFGGEIPFRFLEKVFSAC